MLVSNRFALGIAAVALALPVLAQEGRPLNLSFRIGEFRPQFEGARAADEKWQAFGVDFRLRSIKNAGSSGQSAYWSLSLDSMSADNWRAVPLTLNYASRSNEFYFYAGIGAAWVEEPGEDNETRAALQIGAGWDFLKGKTPVFAEAKYFFSTNNDHFSGFGIYLGVRL